MGGPGERSPGSGFEGAGAPRQPQCITLGRLAPPALSAVRAPAPRLPASHGAAARRARGVQVEGRLAETELRPCPRALRSSGSLSGPTIPVSPQAAGPAVPERENGAGGVSGCSGMPGSEKVQPARQSSRIQGSGHLRTPWRLRCRHGEDRPIGAGKPGLQRPRNDRRFPPPGVKDVPSYGCHPFRRGVAQAGGARF